MSAYFLCVFGVGMSTLAGLHISSGSYGWAGYSAGVAACFFGMALLRELRELK